MLTVKFIVNTVNVPDTTQKLKFFIKDFSGKCDQMRRFLRIWSHLLEKSSMENFIFCAVWYGFIAIVLNIFFK